MASMEDPGTTVFARIVPFALFAGGAAGFLFLTRERLKGWWAWIGSVVAGFLALCAGDLTLEGLTQADLWGPPPRARIGEGTEKETLLARIVPAPVAEESPVPIGDWNGDGVPEFLRTRYVLTQKFHSHSSLEQIEVVSGIDERVLGRVEFHMPFAFPKRCGDLDGDGIEEFAVEYGYEILIYGRESFL